MSRRRQSLMAAILSTICAGSWLINCVLDVSLSIPGSLRSDVLLTLMWASVALIWWLRWRSERCRARENAI